MGQTVTEWQDCLGRGVRANLLLPMFDHVFPDPAVPSKHLEISLCGLDLFGQVLNSRRLLSVLFL